jgi:hypothetical protein
VRIVVGYALTADGRAAVVADLTWADHTRRLEAIVDAATEADACLAAAALGMEALTRAVEVTICVPEMRIAAILGKPSPTFSAHLRERFDKACGRHSIAIGSPTGGNRDDVPALMAARKRAEELARLERGGQSPARP